MAKINYKPLANLVRNISTVSEVLSAANDILFEIKSNLERMHQLALEVRSGQVDKIGIRFIKIEMGTLLNDITRITSNTKFNGATLFNGAFSKQFQVGFNNDSMVVQFSKDMTATGLGIDKLDVMTQENEVLAIDYAIGLVNDELVQIENYQSGVTIIKNNISDIMSSDCAKQCMEQMSYDIAESNYESIESALLGMAETSKVLSVSDVVLSNIGYILGIVRSLAVTGNSGAIGANERSCINKEMDALVAEVTRVAGETKFNGSVIHDGSFTSKTFQVGVASDDTISAGFPQDMRAVGLMINALDVTTNGQAVSSIACIDYAINLVKEEMSKIEDWQDMVYMGKNEIGAIGVCVEQCWE